VGIGSPGRSAFDDPGCREIVARECGLIVAENEHKWYVLRPSADAYDFSRPDRLASFAREKGLGLRGHTLLGRPFVVCGCGRAATTPVCINDPRRLHLGPWPQ
jgi:hypothetical protein